MEIEKLALFICLFISVLSILSSFLTLYLIYSISKYNGYILLVISLTTCQIIYDCSFFILPFYDTYSGRICYGMINMWGGIASALWSNILIFITCQIIITLHSVNIQANYPYYFLFVTIPATIISILEGIFVRHHGSTAIFFLYFIIRSTSIICNILLFIIIFYQLYKLNSLSNKGGTHEEYYKLNSSNPIYVLSMRLIYYCLVQTITRLGASWYQLQFGYGHNYHHETASIIQTTAYLLEYILTPSAGIGYLIVFLLIQPEAKSICWKKCCCCCCCWDSMGLLMRSSSQNEVLTVGLTIGEGGGGGGEGEGYDYEKDDDLDEERRRNRFFSPPGLPGSGTPLLPSISSGGPTQHSTHSSSSLFPLLEMDEDDIAREIDRLYYYTTTLQNIQR